MSKKILIVEDDHDILGLLTDVLNQEGYEVTGLNYTASIIQSVRQHQPDMVLLDFLLPGVNGGELCHDIKINSEMAGLPVVLLSAFPRVLESLGDYGSDGFIAKPFEIDTLLHTVERCLRGKVADMDFA